MNDNMLPIATAPRNGRAIIGIWPDGSELEIRWSEQRRCMLAYSPGAAPGAGTFGAGWEDVENGLVADLDGAPIGWRPDRSGKKAEMDALGLIKELVRNRLTETAENQEMLKRAVEGMSNPDRIGG